MYIVRRKIEDNKNGNILKQQDYKCRSLSKAIDKLNKLRMADRVMYRVAASEHLHLFSDDWHDDVSYVFTINGVSVTGELVDIKKEAFKIYKL